MTVLFTGSYVTILDTNGNPVSGAKCYFYEAGTTTPVTTYSDSALTTANTNPIVADAAGRLGTIFLPADDYKVFITDSEDNEIDTQDNFEVLDIATFTSSRVTNAQTGTSYTIQTTDRSKLLTLSNASAVSVTLPQANSSTFPDGWYVEVKNKGAGTATITPTTSTIDGLTTLTLPTGYGATIYSDGTNYQVQGLHRFAPDVNAQTGTSYTIVSSDFEKLVTLSNASAIAVTLPQANSTTFKGGWKTMVKCIGAGTVTITPTTSTIDGNATLVLTTGESAMIFSDGTNYFSFLVNRDTLGLDTDDDVTFSSVTAYRPIVTETGTSKTLALSDANTFQQCSNASTQTITIPPNADVAFPTGTEVEFFQEGAGTVTIAAGSGVTIRSSGSLLSTSGQYVGAVAKKIDTNEWVLVGNLA